MNVHEDSLNDHGEEWTESRQNKRRKRWHGVAINPQAMRRLHILAHPADNVGVLEQQFFLSLLFPIAIFDDLVNSSQAILKADHQRDWYDIQQQRFQCLYRRADCHHSHGVFQQFCFKYVVDRVPQCTIHASK